MPEPIFIRPTPATNSSENQTTTVRTSAATNTGRNQPTVLRNLTAKNASETQKAAVTKSIVSNAAKNLTAVWIQTTITASTVPDVSHITDMFVSATTTTIPMIESVQTSVNARKSKTRRIPPLTKRIHGRLFLHLEPTVVFRIPIHTHRRTKSSVALPLQKTLWSAMTISLSPGLPFQKSYPWSNRKRILRNLITNRLQTKRKLHKAPLERSLLRISQPNQTIQILDNLRSRI